MTMTVIFTEQGNAAQEISARQRLDRLAAADAGRMIAALQFLAGYDPGTFDAILDAVEPWDDSGVPDAGEDAEPYCVQCGQDVGIFLRFGLGWRHFRSIDATVGVAYEIIDAGHEPVVAWRAVGETGAG